MTFAITRRSALGLMGGAAATSLLPAVPARAARNFVVATFGGTYEETLRKKIIPGFESAHNTKVSTELGIGNTFMPKIIASRNNPPYDVVYLNEDEAIFGEAAGLWAPVEDKDIPNLADIYPIAKPPQLPMYSAMVYEFTLAYNPKKMDAPKSWADLWKPGIKVGVPHISATYGIIFLQIAAELNGGGVDNMAAGFAQLKKLDNMVIYKGVTEGYSKFQLGEMDAALFYRHRAQALMDDGISLAVATPTEGTYGMRTGMRIAKNAPNLELAKTWVNDAMSVDYQMAFAPDLYSPTNSKVVLPPELAAKHVYGADKVNSLRFCDWTKLNPQKPALLEQWNKQFAG